MHKKSLPPPGDQFSFKAAELVLGKKTSQVAFGLVNALGYMGHVRIRHATHKIASYCKVSNFRPVHIFCTCVLLKKVLKLLPYEYFFSF